LRVRAAKVLVGVRSAIGSAPHVIDVQRHRVRSLEQRVDRLTA
jgi:hypothetical protein